MTGGSWLSWNAKKNESINQLSESNEDVIDEDEEHPNDEESEHDDTVPDDNGDEVDDHVKEKRGLGWAFWGNSNTNVESTLQNVKDSKSSGASDQDNVESTLKKDKAVHVGNTILSSTSKFLVKSESTGKARNKVMMLYCINLTTRLPNSIKSTLTKMKIYGKI